MGVSKHIFCFYGYKKYVYTDFPIKEPYLINLISLYIKRIFLSCSGNISYSYIPLNYRKY